MKRILLILALAAPALAQIAIVQSESVHADGTAPVTFVFAAAPAAHDLLVVGCSLYGGATVTPPDSTWTRQAYQTSSDATLAVWTHPVASGEANAYSIAQNNHTTCTAYDLSGAAFYGPINGSAAALTTTANVTSLATPAVTPTVAGTLPLAFVAMDTDTVSAVGSPWSYTAPAAGAHPLGAASHALTTDTTTAQYATFTVSGANSDGLAAATLLIAPYNSTPVAPVANAGRDYSSLTGLPIAFDGSSSSDPKLEALTYLWAFGDDTTSTAVKPSHTYATAGTFAASLTVTNTDSQSATASFPVIVQTGCSGVSLGQGGAFNGYIPSPNDAWHQDISAAPVDPLSLRITTDSTNAPNDLAGAHLHPDFSGEYTVNYGIPYTVVDSSLTLPVPVQVNAYASESDLTLAPLDASTQIESAPADCSPGTGDNHALVFDKHSCVLYELYHAQRCLTGSPRWQADSLTLWDTVKTEQRTYGITSGDAAGLSIFEGLVRYDEVQAGEIKHAIRFTAAFIKNNANDGYFTYPATHSSGTNYGTDNLYGMRLRLKASYDTSALGPQAKIIAAAMKKYGMMLADLGTNLYFQGAPDPRWNDSDLGTLSAIAASDFDVVDGPGQGPLSLSYAPGSNSFYPAGVVYDSENHPTGTAATVSLTASATTITSGTSVTLTPAASTATSYAYIDNYGFVRAGTPVTVSPSVTTTYTLTGRNYFGSSTSAVTVFVPAPGGGSGVSPAACRVP